MAERQIGEKSFGDVFYNDEEYWFKCKMKIVVAMDSFKEKPKPSTSHSISLLQELALFSLALTPEPHKIIS